MAKQQYERETYFQTIHPDDGTRVEITIKTVAPDKGYDERIEFHEHFTRGVDRLLRARSESDVPLGCRIIGNTER